MTEAAPDTGTPPNGAPAGGAPPADTPGGGGAPSEAVWTDGFDDDLKGFVGNKGWQDAKTAVDAYRKRAKFVGADRMAVPKDGDAEGMTEALRRLGAPDDADGYELKVPDGLPEGFYSDDSAKWFRGLAHQANLTKTQAKTLHDAYVQELHRLQQDDATTAKADAAKLDAELRTEWGQAYDQKVELAQRAAAKLGEQAQIDALEKQIGSVPLLRLFANLGAAIGEDKLIGKGQTSFAMTPEEAKAAIAQMDNDATTMQILGDKMHPQHVATKKKRADLFNAAYPGTQRG